MKTETADEYKIGDRDQRPWGSYVVTDVGANARGEEYCEKEITVNPGQILSLQSHENRRETWVVDRGTLTVVLNDAKIQLEAGESIHIPQGAIHCMANLDSIPCTVRERQEGICREADIARYIDAYGRGTEGPSSLLVARSIAVYVDILGSLKKQAA